MWNDWYKKAQDVAANIDKQLNESVGLEVDTPKTPAAVNSFTNGGTNATTWEEDFDDDDDDDNNDNAISNRNIASNWMQQQQQQQTKQQPTAKIASAPSSNGSNKPKQQQQSLAPMTALLATASKAPTTKLVSASPWAKHLLGSNDNDSIKQQKANNNNKMDQSPASPAVDIDNKAPLAAKEGETSSPKEKEEYQQENQENDNHDAWAGEDDELGDLDDVDFDNEEVATDTEPPQQSEPKKAEEVSEPAVKQHEEEEEEEEEKASPSDPQPEPQPQPQPESVSEPTSEPVAETPLEPQPIPVENETHPEPDIKEDKVSNDDIHHESLSAEEQTDEVVQPADETPDESIQDPVAENDQPEKQDAVVVSERSLPVTDTSQHVVESSTTVMNGNTMDITTHPEFVKLQRLLAMREEQLANKAEQMAQMQGMYEAQEQELRTKIQETKDEAKKRILRAKERCEAAEAKCAAQMESSAEQQSVIDALRAEGETLARKQSDMERAVRSAKSGSRELAQQLDDERNAKEAGLEKIAELEHELSQTKELLSSARKGESQAGKLETDLLSIRTESERKAAAILSLEQQIKEFKQLEKELRQQMEEAKKGAEMDAHDQLKKLRKDHNSVIADLELKLRTSEREANVREDALRHEVEELRKRWQDAVRRADALSMDVQSSTAPLLRQLESMERQNRVRATAWTELETKLRSELEETVIQNEKLSKERSEFKTKYNRLERINKEQETELKGCKSTLEEQSEKVQALERELEQVKSEHEKQQEEYSKVERLASEGVARVRSEMSQTVVDSEERYRGQIDKLESQLREEKEKRTQLEEQVKQLLDSSMLIGGISTSTPHPQAMHQSSMMRGDAPKKKLRQTEGQADILAGALGLNDDSDDDENDDDDDGDDMTHDASKSEDELDTSHFNNGGSFAALEALSARLKASKVELETLRKSLKESEATREALVAELAESQMAKEKLPLFEAKVKELTEENREMTLEIRGLRDDIADVRELYRTQLNALLEEKASTGELQQQQQQLQNNGGGLLNDPYDPEMDPPIM